MRPARASEAPKMMARVTIRWGGRPFAPGWVVAAAGLWPKVADAQSRSENPSARARGGTDDSRASFNNESPVAPLRCMRPGRPRVGIAASWGGLERARSPRKGITLCHTVGE